jgi:plasmid stability protein
MSSMPALHIRDVPEATVAAIKRRASRHGHSVQQELRDVLEKAAAEPLVGPRPRRLTLRTVTTGRVEPFDRADFYDDDER